MSSSVQDSSAAEHPTISPPEYDSDSDYSTSFCSTDDYSDDDDDDDDEMLLEDRDNLQSLTHERDQGERERNKAPTAEDIKAWYKEWIANPENLKEPEPEIPCLPRAPSHLVPGTEEYFEIFTPLRKYRRAQHIFDLDSSGQGFRNPLTEPRRRSEGRAPRSPRSPKSKSTTEMRGEYRSAGEQEGGIYNPFEGSEVESSSPSSSRTSSPDIIILGSVLQHFVTIQEPTHSFSSQTAQLCSAENELLTDQAFQRAAADFLNPINVELLVAEHQDLGYTINNNDEHPAKSGYRIRHDFSPHESREGCYCHWCQADRDNNDACEMPEPHDPNAWCHCPTCSIFRLDQQLAAVQVQLGTEMQTHEAQQSRMQLRLQRVHSLRKVREELMERRQKIAAESKTAGEQKRRASSDIMEYQFDAPPARERRGGSGQEDKEKRYGGLFEWVGRQLRDSDKE
jgi:hypothetical protein